MNLLTRCPSCGTAFRVQPAQLSARGGKVRCGKCGTVFNGVAALVEHPSAAASAEPSPQLALFEVGRRAPPADRPPPSQGAVERTTNAPSAAVGSAGASSPAPSVETLLTEEVAPDKPRARPAAGEPGSSPSVRSEAAQAERPAAETARSATTPRAPIRPSPPREPPVEFLREAPPRARLSIVWTLLAVAAAVLLAFQITIYARSEIAARFPATRPALAGLCRALACKLHLPRRPDLMSIESSDLQVDAQHDNVIVLNATIRNQAQFPQEFPSLELTLTDEQDRPVVRRVLAPSEYLSATRVRLQQGIAAGGEAAARVYFDTSRLHATGYRIYLFFP
jgi:predicted Zn finger-like uncharacterized protein